jgi:phosphohistidine phosphatase
MTDARRLLYVLRHGEAAQAAPGAPDFDRPLTPRGRIHVRRFDPTALTPLPTRVWCSPARRTRETFEGLSERMADGAPDATFDPRLYAADAATLLDILGETPVDVSTAAIIGHNPSITTLLRTLLDGVELPGAVVPGAMATLSVSCKWRELGRGSAALVRFDAPIDVD